METKVINYFIPVEMPESEVDGIEIRPREIQAIILKDIKKLSNKKCCEEMNITSKEFNNIINNCRTKIANALIYGNSMKIIEENKINPEDIITTLCSFRCSICGKIYTINYEKEKIVCPLCFSTKIMTNEEAGFCKKK